MGLDMATRGLTVLNLAAVAQKGAAAAVQAAVALAASDFNYSNPVPADYSQFLFPS